MVLIPVPQINTRDAPEVNSRNEKITPEESDGLQSTDETPPVSHIPERFIHEI